MADKKEFTLEDILEEQRLQREGIAQPPQKPEPKQAQPAPQQSKPDFSNTADLNTFATGNIQIPGRKKQPTERVELPQSADGHDDKAKKKKKGLFGRKKRVPDFDEGEDMYYGIQLKPIDEYRKGFDPSTGEFNRAEDSYKALFDDSKKAIDDEVEENFQRLKKERRRRVAQAVQTAGVNEQEIAEEFGVVAPMPVTAFAADPYAKQHGIEVEGTAQQEDLPEIQKAMLETSGDRSMEIKLNVMNDTVEIQRVKEVPAVSEESVSKIMETAEIDLSQADSEAEAVPEPTPVATADELSEQAKAEEAAKPEQPTQDKPDEKKQSGRPLGEIPQVASIYEYRSRSIATHIINAEVLQSALLSESEELKHSADGEQKGMRRSRVRNKKLEEPVEEETVIDSTESIDDYTGPEDAKSISHELRSDMRDYTMRMTITGICTALLALVNLIFGSGLSDAGSSMIVYVVLSVVFLGVSIGFCARPVINGLKALFEFNANSDSAMAVAAVAVAIQTVAAMFFRSDLADGKLHLYAVVLSAILFVNSAGKLTMIRRIHSNFRFITSKEQKYVVRTYDDYNTSLKMAKDAVVDKPLIAYQCKTGFLKRFLTLSYNPDPSEAASQLLAPIGLIASLVVCIACLLLTRSVSTALSAFAAASCACVAVANMLSVNLPISRMCRTARRAGAMVVGYEAVEQLGDVNAVMVDADDIFPRGTVVLEGIKTFGDRGGAEKAIMAASALMKEVGGPLSGVFDQVISENEDSLPEVDNITCEPAAGIVGTVDDQKIYIGTRALLMNHHIELPAKDDEGQYSAGNRAVVYIAIDSAVAAMFVLTYSADRRKKNELQRLEDSGISVLVRSTDPNVTAKMISRLFGVDSGTVSVLEGELGDTAQKLIEQSIPRADAVVATKGRVESMLSVISACVQEKRTANLVVAIQNAAVVLGFVLVAFMACLGGMSQLSSFVLFLFEVFWLLVIIVIPKLRR